MTASVRECWRVCFLRLLSALVGMAALMAAVPGSSGAGMVQNLDADVISTGGGHTCAIRDTGQALCWGVNGHGQLGNNSVVSSNKPVPVKGPTNLILISAGFGHTCAIDAAGQAWCWGRNDRGQLGDGTTTESHVPVKVSGLADAERISAGGDNSLGFSCAIRTSGQAVCWGANAHGQLGNGGGSGSSVPVNVQGLTDAVEITAGYAHACALKTGDQAVCWGANDRGQLGDGTVIDRSVPTNVNAALPGATWISAGHLHSCAISAGLPAKVFCWGGNDDGQLGDGTVIDRLIPTAIPVGGSATAQVVDAGQNSTCAIVGSSGWCWGKNDRGQLGDGTVVTPRLSPVSVIGLTGALDITVGGGDAYAGGSSSGSGHACATRSGNPTVCWGENLAGQLGDGTNTERNLMDVIPTQLWIVVGQPVGSGQGTVESAPFGVNCGMFCAAPFDDNAEVTLTAIPWVGSVFSKWLGACSGTNPVCQVTADSDKLAQAEFLKLYQLTVTVSGPGTGEVTSSPSGIDCGVDCGEEYVDGTTVTLTATPDANMKFVQWMGPGACAGDVSPTCSVDMTANNSATARFEPITHAVSVTRAGAGSGIVTSSPGGIACGMACTASFAQGSTVNLTASAGVGSVFTHWTGDCSGTNPVCALTVGGALSATAHFEPAWALSVNRIGSGTGSVTSSPTGIDCGLDCSEQYPDTTTVQLTATPDPGMVFHSWVAPGPCGGSTSPVCDVTMDSNKTAVARFEIKYHPVDVVLNGSGTGTVTSPPPGINCDPDCNMDFPEGTVLTLTATATTGVFTHWSGDCSGASPTCTVTVNGPIAVGAFFQLEWPVTVTKSGAGSGKVTSSPAGIDCGATCSSTYPETTALVLTATPNPGSVFKQWSSGACSGTNPGCTLLVSGPSFAEAEFVPAHSLAVNLSGNGFGKVTSSPAGIDCGTSCSLEVEEGETVTLTAAPRPGSVFTGWDSGPGGPCSGTSPTCDLTMTGDFTVTAGFATLGHELAVNRTGNGSGKVTSVPTGIDCGSDCDEEYDAGTIVTLTATAEPGSVFTGWSGDCAGSGTSCAVTLDQARTVTASFLKTLPGVKAPDDNTTTYDPATGKLGIRLKCAKRFKPKCLSMKAVAVTGKKGKVMSSQVKIGQRAGKWRLVTLTIKPKYRSQVAALTAINRKTLMIRVDITYREKQGKKVRKATQRVFPKYRVRVKR